MDANRLPFDIETSLADRRGSVQYVAVRDGERLAIGKYVPGDIDKRRKTAVEWAPNAALHNGEALTVAAVSQALERAECDAAESVDKWLSEQAAENAEESGDGAREAASYVNRNKIVELAWNSKDGEPDYIVFDRNSHKVTRTPAVETDSGIIRPPKCCSGVVTPGCNIPGIVLLPTEYDETGLDESKLREDVHGHIERYVELPGDAAYIAVEYVLLSWVFHDFDEVAYLAFRTADAGRGKSRALETVGAVCYRPILCGGGSTAAATLRLVHLFGGTLLCDEYDQRDTDLAAEITRLLNQGFQRNRPLVKCDGEVT